MTQVLNETAKIAAIRADVPAAERAIYLNSGTSGPMPTAALAAMAAWHASECEDGRIGGTAMAKMLESRTAIRDVLSRFVHAPVDSLAVLPSTSSGMHVSAFDVPWREGDEIVTTDAEFPSLQRSIHQVEKRFGAKIRVVPIGLGSGDITPQLAEHVSDRTKMIAISHVSYSTGAVFDLAAIVGFSRPKGIVTLVDGAQSVGALDVDLEAIGADYYAFAGQKWLNGPSATGALYVHPSRLDDPSPFAAADSPFEHFDHIEFWKGAKRFEAGTKVDAGAVAGLTAAVGWYLDTVGPAWAFDRAHRLALRAVEGLRDVPNLELHVPADIATLVCFTVRDTDPQKVVDHLAAQGILVRTIPNTTRVRFAVGFFNTEDEIDTAVRVVSEFAAGV